MYIYIITTKINNKEHILWATKALNRFEAIKLARNKFPQYNEQELIANLRSKWRKELRRWYEITGRHMITVQEENKTQ